MACQPLQHCMDIMHSAPGVADRGGGDQRMLSNYSGNTLPSLHRKVYARVLEWRVYLLAKSQIQGHSLYYQSTWSTLLAESPNKGWTLQTLHSVNSSIHNFYWEKF